MSRRQIVVLAFLGVFCVGLLLFKLALPPRVEKQSPSDAARGASVPSTTLSTALDSRWPGAVSASVDTPLITTTTLLEMPSPAETAQPQTEDRSRQLELEVEQRLAALRARKSGEPMEPFAIDPVVATTAEATTTTQTTQTTTTTTAVPQETLPRKLPVMSADAFEETDALTAELAVARQEIQRLNAELQIVVQASARIRSLEGEKSELTVALKRNESELRRLREENERLRIGFDRLREKSESDTRSLHNSQEQSETALKSDLKSERQLKESLQRDVARLQKELEPLKTARGKLEETEKLLATTKSELESARGSMETLSKTSAASKKELEKTLETSQKSVKELEAKLAAQTAQSQQYSAELLSSGTELAQLKEKNDELQKELVEARNGLLLAQAQLEALNKAAPTTNRSTGNPTPVPSQSVAPGARRSAAGGATERGDFQFLQVVVPKANLRAGPGDENSVVMEVPKDSVLLVEEKRGEWYRIISPTGSRAWIRGDVVRLPSNASTDTATPPSSLKRARRADDASVSLPIVPRVTPAAPRVKSMPEEFDDEATKAYQRLKESLAKPPATP